MRVIGGEFRSRVLKSVPGLDTRPTPDRLREALFSILAPRIAGAVFADLYAGTGAVGIEALSRGASRAVFAELSRPAVGIIRENLKSLGLESRADVRQSKATALAPKLRADIVFLDPPYKLENDYSIVMHALEGPSLVIAQHDVRLKLAAAYGSLHQTRTLRQGDNCLSFYEPSVSPEAAPESPPDHPSHDDLATGRPHALPPMPFAASLTTGCSLPPQSRFSPSASAPTLRPSASSTWHSSAAIVRPTGQLGRILFRRFGAECYHRRKRARSSGG